MNIPETIYYSKKDIKWIENDKHGNIVNKKMRGSWKTDFISVNALLIYRYARMVFLQKNCLLFLLLS